FFQALLLLCAIELLCSDGAAAQDQTCIRTHEVVCFVPPDNMTASEPINISVSAGMKLNISLEHLSGYSACQWMRGGDLVQTVNEIHSMVTPRPLSVSDSGEYKLSCKTGNITSSVTVSLHVMILDTNNGGNEEVSNVTVSAGQPLLLRCRIQDEPRPVWEKGSEIMDSKTLKCCSEANEICIKNDSHLESLMAYLFIKSVGVHHSGTYTCRSQNKIKSVYIHVQAEGFVSATLDETKIVPAENASKSCLQANVSYEPVLEHCFWEATHEGNFIEDDKDITFETESLVPANFTWMSCPMSNDSCETWEEIASQTDPDVSCSKTIKSSVKRDQANGNRLKFCLKNSITEWCREKPTGPQVHLIIGSVPDRDDNSVMMLKLASLSLLLALMAVCVVLVYFVKKKKPKYQPQLQMIQMVGPNDNDYIYINFKDFEYDQKWEFPRENLELGTELGSGAFGMVVQATAYGINKPGVSQQVAVKMLKEKHQTVEKEALMSELKMLTHIGHHANIVNLLGACTDSGPIYLIFQYCCYGDLLNYLKKNRERYHKSVTDAFDKDRFRSIYHNLQLKKSTSVSLEETTMGGYKCRLLEIDTVVDSYVPMHTSTTRGQKDIALLHLNSDPEIYENLHDQTEDLQVLTFDDLLSFAFQVAKGMEFLSSKHCIHRDLAARNVLVTKGRLIKIGDFGLARDIDNDSNYVVRGNVRHMMSFYMMIGCYVLDIPHHFLHITLLSVRYAMMCECWALDPNSRPSFSKLVSFTCDRLMVREEELYQNLPDQTSSEYKNTPAIIDISALTKQSESKTQLTNDYYRSNASEESRTEMSDTEGAEEKLLKPPDTE
ncbi:Receptor-type tyrosine-protein kinase FLT3, partial [Nibea albiflora]